MPRVPTDNRILTSTALRLAPQQQVNPDAFGAGLGEGIQRAASTVQSQIVAPMWDRINQARVLEADTLDAKGDSEARLALAQAKGKDAAKAFGDLEAKRQDHQREIEATLSNPAQVEAFRARAANRLAQFQAFGEGHVVAEGIAYEDQTMAARQKIGLERIVSMRGNTDDQYQEMGAYADEYLAWARKRGIPDEAIKVNLDTFRSKATLDSIAGLLDDQNDLAAADTFKQHEMLLNADDRQAAQKMLERGTVNGEAQRITDRWMLEGMDLAKLNDRLATDPALKNNVRLRDEVQQRAITALRLRDEAVKEDQGNAYAEAYKIIQDPIKSYSDIPDSILRRLDKRPDLDLHLRTLAAKADRVTTTDRATLYQLQIEAVTNPQAFAKVNLMDYAAKLSDGDFKELTKLKADAMTGKGESTGWLTTREERVNQALASINIDPRPYITKDGTTTPNPAAVQFRDAVEKDAMIQARSAGRTNPNAEDVQKAIDATMLRRVRLSQWGTDPDVVAVTVTADERGNAYVPLYLINTEKQAAIRTLIQKAGGTPTDDRVQRYMAARVMGNTAMMDEIEKER